MVRGHDDGGQRLDRAELVRGAAALLDAEGLDGFSMRRLATSLGVRSPSLYWHVRGKEELFDLLVDDLIGRCPLPASRQPWSEALAALAGRLRRLLLDHPAVARLLPGRVPDGPHGLRLADHVVGTLRRAGFDNRLASHGYLVLLYYVVGFAGQEIAFGKGPGNHARLTEYRNRLRALSADDYPDLSAVADEIVAGKLTDRFTLGLTGILDGLAARRG